MEKLSQSPQKLVRGAGEKNHISNLAAQSFSQHPNLIKSSSPYCTMSASINGVDTTKPRESQMVFNMQLESTEQQRLITTLAPKSGSSMKQQNLQQQMKSYQNDDEYVVSATNQPYCSCKSYVIIDSHHSKVLQSKNKDEVREMASLTKMMTALVSLELA